MSFNILKDSLPISFLSYPMFTKIGVFFWLSFLLAFVSVQKNLTHENNKHERLFIPILGLYKRLSLKVT